MRKPRSRAPTKKRNADERQRVITLRAEGRNIHEVAAVLGVSLERLRTQFATELKEGKALAASAIDDEEAGLNKHEKKLLKAIRHFSKNASPDDCASYWQGARTFDEMVSNCQDYGHFQHWPRKFPPGTFSTAPLAAREQMRAEWERNGGRVGEVYEGNHSAQESESNDDTDE